MTFSLLWRPIDSFEKTETPPSGVATRTYLVLLPSSYAVEAYREPRGDWITWINRDRVIVSPVAFLPNFTIPDGWEVEIKVPKNDP